MKHAGECAAAMRSWVAVIWIVAWYEFADYAGWCIQEERMDYYPERLGYVAACAILLLGIGLLKRRVYKGLWMCTYGLLALLVVEVTIPVHVWYQVFMLPSSNMWTWRDLGILFAFYGPRIIFWSGTLVALVYCLVRYKGHESRT